MEQSAPLNIDPNSDTNVVLIRERAFEGLCAAIEENNCPDPGSLPAFRFYARWQVLHERAEALRKLKTKK